jgi:hypothetical protein
MRQVTIFMLLRDSTSGEVVGSQEAYGDTNDDGATVVIPAGYLPAISNAQPGDVKVTVHKPSDEYPNAAYVERSAVDEEANTWTLKFNLGDKQ